MIKSIKPAVKPNNTYAIGIFRDIHIITNNTDDIPERRMPGATPLAKPIIMKIPTIPMRIVEFDVSILVDDKYK
jgi:hypothetical protein